MRSLPSPAALLERYALVLLAVGVFAFFALNPETPQFDSGANLKNIVASQSVLGILAIATLIPLVAAHIDLSVAPAAGLTSLICAGMMATSGATLPIAVLVALAVGLAIGVTNGVLVTRVGINSIVATLGTSSIIAALVIWYSDGVAIVSGISPTLTDVGVGDWLGLPKPFWFLAAVALAAYYVLDHTPVGRYLYSAGSNARAAGLVGIRVPRLGFASFVASGGLAAVAGVLLVAVQGGGNPQVGVNYTLPALAAVFLGATTIRPGQYNVPGAMVAILLLAFSVNGLTLLGAEPWVSDMFTGVALLAGVAISVHSGRRRSGGSQSRGVAPRETGSAMPGMNQ